MKKADVRVAIPHLWGGQPFIRSEWSSITWFVGPNGTGKTSLAEKVLGALGARMLNSRRLAGFGKDDNHWMGNSIGEGLRLGQQRKDWESQSRTRGDALGIWYVLRDKVDVRLRVESVLDRLLGLRVRLAEEAGFLQPYVFRRDGVEYGVRTGESEGVKELIAILVMLYDRDERFVILDEPEMHLHPQFQQFVMAEVRRLASESKSFIIISHSPYFVDVRTLDELSDVIVFRPGKTPAWVHDLDDNDKYRLARLLPRLNTHHRQFFFATRPVFVEGYLDQQIFSLVQERRGEPIGGNGVSIIDVGGKEAVDAFVRLCHRLDIDAHAIVDDDAIFEGKLTQAAGADDAVTRFVNHAGLARRLDDLLGDLKRSLDDVTKGLLALAPEVIRENGLEALIESLRADVEKPDLRRRLITLRFINRMPKTLRSLLGANATAVDFAIGLHQKSLEALKHGAVHVLPRGTLEHHYQATDVSDRGLSSEDAKRKAFEAERERLLGLGRADINAQYPELVAVLDAACGSLVIDVIPLLAEHLGNWIHRVQTAWRQGRLQDTSALQPMLAQGIDRTLEIITLDTTPNGFRCRIRLAEIVDPARRYMSFDQDTVPSSLIETLESSFEPIPPPTDGAA